jgi:hypothetical protein
MFFKKTEIQSLIQRDDADRKMLEAARAEKAKLMPGWVTAQEMCEGLAAANEVHGFTYRRGVDEEVWKARPIVLEGRLELAIAQRDGIFQEVNAEINSLNGRIQARQETFIGAFSSWAQRVAAGHREDDPICQTLQETRQHLEQLRGGRLGQIIDLVNSTVEQIESLPDVDAPIFRFSDICRRCFALAPEATVTE